MKFIVYIAASLDGYIATPDGGVEWLNEIPNPAGSDFGWADFMARIDAVLMGRKTFEKVLTFGAWPYPKPVYVLSATLKELPEDLSGKAEILTGAFAGVIRELEKRGYHEIYIDGGQLIQGFLAADLVDELILTRVPILLGRGIPLFAQQDQMLSFQHQKTEVFNNHLVKSHYRRQSSPHRPSPLEGK